MSSLRILGLSYLATASLLTLASVLCVDAALRMVANLTVHNAAREFQNRVMAPVLLSNSSPPGRAGLGLTRA